jgi:hypothetical protein
MLSICVGSHDSRCFGPVHESGIEACFQGCTFAEIHGMPNNDGLRDFPNGLKYFAVLRPAPVVDDDHAGNGTFDGENFANDAR